MTGVHAPCYFVVASRLHHWIRYDPQTHNSLHQLSRDSTYYFKEENMKIMILHILLSDNGG